VTREVYLPLVRKARPAPHGGAQELERGVHRPVQALVHRSRAALLRGARLAMGRKVIHAPLNFLRK
jgi:hypothetical protein